MQSIGSELRQAYDADIRNLREVVEFYPPYETNLTPGRAFARFSAWDLSWAGYAYRREITKRGDIQRTIGASSNSVSLTFSNLDRFMAAFALDGQVEGLRLVIRVIDPDIHDDSQVVFVGRVEKPAECDQKQVVITAKDDLASLDVEIPPRTFEKTCPLDFKKADCLGTESLDDKSTAYKEAPRCNKTWDACNGFDNLPFFQGFKIAQVQGGFVFKIPSNTPLPVGFTKIRGRWTFGSYSSQDDTPYGQEIPMIWGGRVQLLGMPVEGVDAGFTLKTRQVFCEGPVGSIGELVPRSEKYPTIAVFAKYLGYYGNQSGQSLDGTFPGSGWFSRTANAVAHFNGSTFQDVEEPPTMSALIVPGPVKFPNADGEWVLSQSTDNPACVVRAFLTHPRTFNLPDEFIDDAEAFDTFNWCNGLILDDSQGEQLFLPTSVSSIAGTDEGFRRFSSTGRIRFNFFDNDFAQYVQELEADYNFFDPDDPPDTIAPVRYIRKRWTHSSVSNQKVKEIDFLNKVILPSFRGFLVRASNGKVKIKSERPTGTAYIRGTLSAGITAVPVTDVQPWVDKPGKLALFGANAVTSEVRRITGVQYSLAANDITLEAEATGTLTATASGATLADGDLLTPATGRITIGGTTVAGAQAVATIDGIEAAYTLAGGETLANVAQMLAAFINATPDLYRFVTATTDGADVVITSKYGALVFDDETTNPRVPGEEVLLLDAAFGPSSIIQNSFKWPLGNRQSSINRIEVTYQEAKDDYAPVILNVNDYDHQDQIGKVSKREIDGSGIDNFNQASRIANQELAREREGNFFASWSSRSADALLIEEGDVVAVSDTSGEFVNLPVRIEDIRLSEKLVASFTARRYTTAQYSDEAGQQTVALPTALLPAVPLPPPIVTDLAAVEVETPSSDGTRTRRTRITFTFSPFRGQQLARILIQVNSTGPYVEVAAVYPRSTGEASFDYFGLPAGTHNVKVQSESAAGLTQSSGHPVVSVTTRKPQTELANLISLDGLTIFSNEFNLVVAEV